MIRAFAILLALALLAGCASSPEELAARDDATCRSYGAAPGTPEYVQSRSARESDRANRRPDVGVGVGVPVMVGVF